MVNRKTFELQVGDLDHTQLCLELTPGSVFRKSTTSGTGGNVCSEVNLTSMGYVQGKCLTFFTFL